MFRSRLTIKHLEMIRAIDAAATSTRAAEMLNISQPALSSRLHDAEEILGVRLFVRRGRRLSISPAGQLLLESARTILAELERIESEFLNLSQPVRQPLRIGMPRYAAFSWLPAAITAFEKQFPDVAIEIVSEAAVLPRHALLRNEVDIAIVSSPHQDIHIDKRRFMCRKLIRDEFVALLPACHEKAGRPYLLADDFVEETYVTNSAIPEENREYDLFFRPNSINPARVVQVGFTSAVLELVAAGIGTTILTRWTMETGEQMSNVVALPLTQKGLYVHWFAIYPRSHEIEAQARLLCDVIAESAGG